MRDGKRKWPVRAHLVWNLGPNCLAKCHIPISKIFVQDTSNTEQQSASRPAEGSGATRFTETTDDTAKAVLDRVQPKFQILGMNHYCAQRLLDRACNTSFQAETALAETERTRSFVSSCERCF